MKCEPGEHHPVPDDLDRLSGPDHSHHLLLGRYWDGDDQLTTDLTVGDRASRGRCTTASPIAGPRPNRSRELTS